MILQGNIFDYFIVFGAGVLVSFSPCVYPVLPLIVGYISGVNVQGNRLTGFLLSLIYVFGLALVYSSLAILASLTGRVFGVFQNQPIIYIIIAVLLIFFSLVIFEIVKLPSFQVTLNQRIRKKNVWTVMLFGMVSGLAVSPCTSPILGTLLLYAGSKQNLFHAASLMFVFSYGVGFSLILVGTFSGFLHKLPKSGAWMKNFERFGGFIILILGVWFLIKGIKLWM